MISYNDALMMDHVWDLDRLFVANAPPTERFCLVSFSIQNNSVGVPTIFIRAGCKNTEK